MEIPISEHINTVFLDRIRKTAEIKLTGHTLQNFKAHSSFIGEDLWLKLETEVMAEKTQETSKEFSFQKPRNTWEQFKSEFFPLFLLKRFPIRMVYKKFRVTFERYEQYPQLSKVFDKHLGKRVPINFLTSEVIDDNQC